MIRLAGWWCFCQCLDGVFNIYGALAILLVVVCPQISSYAIMRLENTIVIVCSSYWREA